MFWMIREWIKTSRRADRALMGLPEMRAWRINHRLYLAAVWLGLATAVLVVAAL